MSIINMTTYGAKSALGTKIPSEINLLYNLSNAFINSSRCSVSCELIDSTSGRRRFSIKSKKSVIRP